MPDQAPDQRMRYALVSADSIALMDGEVPRPAPHAVLVRSVVAGICGSDTHAAHGAHPFITLPYRPGHEVVGVVHETGSEVDSFLPGQRVTVEPDLPCWHCKQCDAGRENICENLRFFGCAHDQGGLADYFTIDARRLHLVPDELSYRAAALIEPLSTPVHAVRLAGDVKERAVVILGAGTIGLLLLRVVIAHGAKRVVVTDVLPDKRERALRLGADAVVDAAASDVVDQVRRALGESADVVFDCVAIAPTVQQGVAMASKGGTVMIVGVPTKDVMVPLAVVQDQQIRIQGSATYLPEDYAESIDLLIRGVIPVDDVITAVFGLDSLPEAFAASLSGHQIKVLVSIDAAQFGANR